jgi:CRISPR-associated protein Csx10
MNYFVSARADSPLAFRVGRDPRREKTLGYVPGSALLGGLATAHSLSRPRHRDEFAEFFLQEQIVFGNLYPAIFSKPQCAPNPLDAFDSPVRPLPRTARSCKRFSGFLFNAQVEDDDRHGVWDSLIAWAAFALSNGNNPTLLAQRRDCQFPNCQEPMDTFAGFYRRGNAVGEWGTADAKIGMFTRTGISRARGSAAEGILYSREFLRANNIFYGEWQADSALVNDFQRFLNDISGGMLRVGHNRTRGLGKLVFPDDLQQTNTDTADDIEARARNFDALLRQNAGADARHAFYLPVTLTADCIWPDAAGRYRLQITSDAIAEAWGINDAELVYCNAAARRVSGWSSLWGLPKSDEWAIAMGSVFLFGLSAAPDWQALASGYANGLGTRRTEGFGTVRIADEFHVEVNGV